MRFTLIEPDPHHGQEFGCIAGEPRVAVVVGRAGLARRGVQEAAPAGAGAGAVFDRGSEEMGQQIRRVGIDPLFRAQPVFLDDRAGAAGNPGYGRRRDERALIGQRAVGDPDVERRDLDRPQRKGRIGRERSGEAESKRGLARRFQADLLSDARRGSVHGAGQRRLQTDEAVVPISVIARAPLLILVEPRKGRVLDEPRRQIPAVLPFPLVLDRGEKHDRFEDRTGLPVRLGDAVELRVLIVAAADHRQDMAGLRLDGDQARLQLLVRLIPFEAGMRFLDRGQPLLHRLAGEFLQSHVEGREDVEPRLGQGPGRIAVLQPFADEVGKIRGLVPFRRRRTPAEVFLHGRARLVGREVPPFRHASQHVVAAPERALGVPVGRVPVGRLDHAGQDRGLSGRQVARRFPEIEAGRFPDAEDTLGAALAQIDLVQIVFEDLQLGVMSLDNQRNAHFGQLALHGTVLRQKEVLHQLLGDRAAALNGSPSQHVGPTGPQDAPEVDAVMLEKALILGRQHGFHEQGRHVVELDDPAFFDGPRVQPGDDLGLGFDDGEFGLVIEVHQPLDPIPGHRHADPLGAAPPAGHAGLAEEDLQVAGRGVLPVLSARLNGMRDAVIFQPFELIGQRGLFEIESGVEEYRTGVDFGWDRPVVVGEARHDFALQLVDELPAPHARRDQQDQKE